jgi:prepilin-type N-terminal cleavage/methylation domain-containing protein
MASLRTIIGIPRVEPTIFFPMASPVISQILEAMRGTKKTAVCGACATGFTLLELLVVIAVIAILAGILIPAASAVRRSVVKSRTQAQFGQYAIAFEQFKAEYGYYPKLGTSGSGDTRINLEESANNEVFIETFSGRRRNGEAVSNVYARKANPKKIAFYTFSESEFAANETVVCGATIEKGAIVDGFGNPNIVVVIDSDRNGVISGGLLPGEGDVHAGVVIYSDPGSCEDWREVRSWR